MSHDEVVEEAIAARDALSRTEVVRGFRYSLTNRRRDLRSALGSFAATLNLQPHGLVRWDGVTCAVCGTTQTTTGDLNVLNFERFKWGGVRHFYPEYAAFDLRQFAVWAKDLPDEPGPVEALLHDIGSLPAGRAQQAADSLRSHLKSSNDERRTVIGILGIAGILQPRDLASMRTSYVTYEMRNSTSELHPGGRTDWDYPVYRWSHADGIDAQAASFWFSE